MALLQAAVVDEPVEAIVHSPRRVGDARLRAKAACENRRVLLRLRVLALVVRHVVLGDANDQPGILDVRKRRGEIIGRDGIGVEVVDVSLKTHTIDAPTLRVRSWSRAS